MKVFICGSVDTRIDPKFLEGIREVGNDIADHNDGIMCVGCKTGSIGEMYNTMIERDGFVDIIVPAPYAASSEGMIANSITRVDTLYMLQQVALRNTEVTIVLPGGNGTLAELYMITDSIKSGFDTDTVIVFNINGFYDKIRDMNDFMLEAGVLDNEQYNFFTWCNTADEVIDVLNKVRADNLRK